MWYDEGVMEGCYTFEEIVADCGQPDETGLVGNLEHGFAAHWGDEWVWFDDDGTIIDGIIPERCGLVIA